MENEVLTHPQSAASWTSFQRMRARLAERLGRELTRETGLSEADFEILAVLAETPGTAVRSLALRCDLEWEKSRLSHQLRRMEQRGLIRREICVEDSRSFVIRATDEGCKLARLARCHHDEAVQRYVFDVLTPEQLESLGTISDAILANLAEPH